MKKGIFLSLIVTTLVGCQTTQQATFEPNDSSISKTETTFLYSPNGKEQFVFNEIAELFQKNGYDSFCPNTKSFHCYNRLSYKKYLGMKGFFDTEEPVKTDSLGHEFYPVILENGEKYYFISNKNYGGKYSIYSIISLEKYQELKSFKEEPLIPGSTTQLLSSKINYGSKTYLLSNGQSISQEKLNLIREVCNKYGNKPEMAEILLNMKIDKDEVDYRFFITPNGDTLRSEAKLYVGVNDKIQWLRFKVKYYGDDWLFVNSYKVAADDYRWQSPQMKFERDHASGDVWEWSDVSATEKHIEVAKKLANSNKSTIRFQGNQYYSDKHLTDDQKASINSILKLFELMKSV